MSTKGRIGCCLTLIASLAMVGCTQRIGDFTILSSKNVGHIGTAGPRVKGSDCVLIILFPLGLPNMKTAVDKAIESAGPGYDALSDVVLSQTSWAFIIGQSCYDIEGTALKSPAHQQTSLEQRGLFYHSSVLDQSHRSTQSASLEELLKKKTAAHTQG